jgi:hypothetical protein
MYFWTESAAEGIRVIRGGAGGFGFSVKLLAASIDEFFASVWGSTKRVTGVGTSGNRTPENRLCSHTQEKSGGMKTLVVATIQSHLEWEFAFEGGAHILFRHIGVDRRFVTLPPSCPPPGGGCGVGLTGGGRGGSC